MGIIRKLALVSGILTLGVMLVVGVIGYLLWREMEEFVNQVVNDAAPRFVTADETERIQPWQ